MKISMSLAMMAVAISSPAAGAGTKTLHGNVPAIVSKIQSKGHLGEQELNLNFGLPLRNQEALSNLLQQIYDPASPNYHHFLTPEQFTEQFGPTTEDYRKVMNFAAVNGFKVIGTVPNRMLLKVSGKTSDIERAFHITLRTYHHPTENRDFFAPDVEPSVAADLPILDVSGLDNLRRPHSHYKIKSNINSSQSGASAKATPAATTGSGPSGNYVGDDFRNAYVPGAAALNGSGQVVALVEFDGYLASDINLYESLFNRTNVPLQNVLIDGFNGLPTGTGGEVEVSLDIEVAIAMAPALSKVIVYEGNPNVFFPNDTLNQIAVDNKAKQISSSWTWTGGPQTTTDQIFKEMALQGQTYLQCSTDFDAYPTGLADSPFFFGTPADSPYVTSVGGTTLTMNGAGASYASETVWNWDVRYGPGADGIGSSGGISSFYSIPSWQTNINMPARGGSSVNRNFPDVAMTGDDTLVIADGGFEYVGVGGTSIAAPLWAGFIALANQQATNNAHAPIGFLNPAIYGIANSPNYTNCFHDVKTGNNEWSQSPTLFVAHNNYDLCTGLGTPNGTNLINALTAVGVTNPVTHLSPPSGPYGTAFATMTGGNPNGTWDLFVLDDAQLDSGMISNGWSLTLTLANVVGDAADNLISMSATPGTVSINNTAAYILTVTNYGPSTSSNVVVSDNFPAGLPLVSTNATQGTVIHAGAELIWNIGNLATNAGAQLTLTVQPNASGVYENDAIVSATTPDSNFSDDFATANITVGTVSAPSLTGSAVAANGLFQFSITSGANQTNVVQATTNLTTGPWIPVYTNIGSFVYTNFYGTNFPDLFFRDVIIGP